jgi:hypothetical protein
MCDKSFSEVYKVEVAVTYFKALQIVCLGVRKTTINL